MGTAYSLYRVVLHVRFLQVVMACVFDLLLPGVCLHAFCHTLFLGPLVLFSVFYSFIFRIIFIIICFSGYSEV